MSAIAPLRLWLMALIVLAGFAGGLAGSYAAFSANTANSGNSVAAGTVTVDKTAGAGKLFDLSAMKPADSAVSSCIRVTYTGSLNTNMGLFHQVYSGTLDSYLQLTVTRGTFSSTTGVPSCASVGFNADSTNYLGSGAGVVYSGVLSSYGTQASPITDPPSGTPEVWTTNETHDYKLTISVNNNSAAQGLTLDDFFAWGARNT